MSRSDLTDAGSTDRQGPVPPAVDGGRVPSQTNRDAATQHETTRDGLDHRLAKVLRDFAYTMGTDFPIQAILDHLVGEMVAILPVTAAGVTLISPDADPRYIAASNSAALRYEQLQTELDEGPCLLAYRSGRAVAVPDLAAEHRFPAFTPRALAAGLQAVFTFPLRHEAEPLGALDLYRDTPGPLSPAAMDAAQTLADVAAAYLLNARARLALKEAGDRSRQQALHDPLTGLPNRTLILDRLAHACRRNLSARTRSAPCCSSTSIASRR